MRTSDGKNAFSKLHPLNKQCYYYYGKKRTREERALKRNIRTPAEINLGRYKFSLYTYIIYYTCVYNNNLCAHMSDVGYFKERIYTKQFTLRAISTEVYTVAAVWR